jgi:hypothetical protein
MNGPALGGEVSEQPLRVRGDLKPQARLYTVWLVKPLHQLSHGSVCDTLCHTMLVLLMQPHLLSRCRCNPKPGVS